MKLQALFLLITMLTVGCAHTGYKPEEIFKNDTSKISDLFVFEKHKFDKENIVKGPWIHDQPGFRVGNRYFLRGFVDKKTNKIVRHQLYVESGYQSGNWKYYEVCVDESINNLKCVKIDRSVGHCVHGMCIYKEQMGFTLSKQRLQKLVKNKKDFIFAMKTNGGEATEFKLDHRYVEAYLKALDKGVDKIAIAGGEKAKRSISSMQGKKKKSSGPGY